MRVFCNFWSLACSASRAFCAFSCVASPGFLETLYDLVSPPLFVFPPQLAVGLELNTSCIVSLTFFHPVVILAVSAVLCFDTVCILEFISPTALPVPLTVFVTSDICLLYAALCSVSVLRSFDISLIGCVISSKALAMSMVCASVPLRVSVISERAFFSSLVSAVNLTDISSIVIFCPTSFLFVFLHDLFFALIHMPVHYCLVLLKLCLSLFFLVPVWEYI